MRKLGRLATVVLLAMVLLTSGVGTAAAEPQKNQILIEDAECDNGQSYTFVINGMSKVGQISGGNDNFVVTEFIVTYRDAETNVFLGEGTFDKGKAEASKGNSPQKDAISCTGSTITELQNLGVVKADFDFKGFVTPRGEQ